MDHQIASLLTKRRGWSLGIGYINFAKSEGSQKLIVDRQTDDFDSFSRIQKFTESYDAMGFGLAYAPGNRYSFGLGAFLYNRRYDQTDNQLVTYMTTQEKKEQRMTSRQGRGGHCGRGSGRGGRGHGRNAYGSMRRVTHGHTGCPSQRFCWTMNQTQRHCLPL